MYISSVEKDTSIRKRKCFIAFCLNCFFSKCVLFIHLPSSISEVSGVVPLVSFQ